MLPLLTLIKEYRQGLAAFVLMLVALFLMLSVRPGDQQGMNSAQSLVLDIMGGLQRLILSPVEATRAAGERIDDLMALDAENRRLKRELARMAPLQLRAEELRRENQRLKELLSMPADPLYGKLAARVIGDSSSAFAHSLMINAGRDSGAALDSVVMGARGLVGRVIQLGEKHSLVLSILDVNSRVPVMAQRSRIKAMAAGANDRLLRLEFVAREADLEAGDLIITSGSGGVFPKELAVGHVVSLQSVKAGLFQTAWVKPIADFDRLEEVRLLTPATLPDDRLAAQ
ncbi:rod shape-determining protein MreC [Magnetofaba australis]|uniref:Cell shape-determining protein MreC n=1 Tax=Magnetofaba australis IT-1 TaxID=1434232 RepID=A0A1Y2K2C3_9PROT|nr:rod shape-determining protein MreC [Magnetofaba australis]OSM02191.1 putative rod shape-determining protein MreC [Magnetofaba australis IT-1]